MNNQPALVFDNSYARLPERFYSPQLPTPVAKPGLIRVNDALARYLEIDPEWLASDAGIEVLAGNAMPAGAASIATAYAGHQFGSWNPQLGDGRAILLGEIIASDGARYDLQLKGSGPTRYSRGGDGRSPIGPVLREYIVSEAMAAMGVATTRALAAVTTGDWVMRDGAIPGGIIARVASSHIRIGTLQFFAARQDTEALQLLVDHVIERHYPEAALAENPCRAMLDAVVAGQARLVASWQLLGFIHGVMNTDNMLLSGETIDYGPCAFMDSYHPDKVFSSIDRNGRYAYSNQPGIAYWNLGALAQALLPLLNDDQDAAVVSARQAIDNFPVLYKSAYQQGMSDKLGLGQPIAEDQALVDDLLTLMTENSSDFTLTFRRLSELADADQQDLPGVSAIMDLPEAFAPWLQRWRQRTAADPMPARQRRSQMLAVNPVFIPRNHLIEETISAAVHDADYAPFHALVDRLAKPYDYREEDSRYALAPQPKQVVSQTFCGT